MEFLQIFREKLNGKKSAGSWILLAILVGGYLFFFSSQIWMPSSNEYVEPTKLYEVQILEEQQIYVTRWEYSEREKAMQIALELESKSLIDQKLSFEAVERSAGELKVTAVIEQADHIVFYIEDLPDKWKEVSLRVWGEDQDSMIRLYTNIDDVVRADDDLPGRDTVRCEVYRLEGQMEYDTYRISEREEEIASLEEENESLQKRISDLKSAKYPTEEEAQEAGDTVSRAESRIESNNTEIENLRGEIGQLEQEAVSIDGERYYVATGFMQDRTYEEHDLTELDRMELEQYIKDNDLDISDLAGLVVVASVADTATNTPGSDTFLDELQKQQFSMEQDIRQKTYL